MPDSGIDLPKWSANLQTKPSTSTTSRYPDSGTASPIMSIKQGTSHPGCQFPESWDQLQYTLCIKSSLGEGGNRSSCIRSPFTTALSRVGVGRCLPYIRARKRKQITCVCKYTGTTTLTSLDTDLVWCLSTRNFIHRIGESKWNDARRAATESIPQVYK